MRELVYYVATSLDGFIAREDGSFADFNIPGEHVDDFLDSYRWFDTVLMGRNTYEVGVNMGTTNPYPMLQSLVFSRSMDASPDEAVELVSDNAIARVRDLKKQEGKPIWLCGGADLATDLHGAGLIDRLIIKLNPLILGTGIPMFRKSISEPKLELTKHQHYPNGVALLYYQVLSAKASGDG